MNEPGLEGLLAECTVRVSGSTKGGFGTGFFVAPGLVLTCAHVVVDAGAIGVKVPWREGQLTAALDRYYPPAQAGRTSGLWPDIALLRVDLDDHPCVLLDPAVGIWDELYGFGYSEKFPEGEPLTVIFEGHSPSPALMKLKGGQVVPGFSGAPLLNLRTGGVCGVIKASRDVSFDLGGRGVSAEAVLSHFGELAALQEEFHRRDARWRDRPAPSRPRSPHVPFGRDSGDAPEGQATVTSVLVEGQSVTVQLRLKDIPVRPTFVQGQFDSELVWLTRLIQSEEGVVVTFGGDDAVTSYLLKAVKKFSPPPATPPAVTLVLGNPTREPEKWPRAGVYRLPDGERARPVLIAHVDQQPDEALFMWLVALTFRGGRAAELDAFLGGCPKEVASRIGVLRQKHSPELGEVESHLGKGASLKEPPPIKLPALGKEIVDAFLAAQVETSADLLAAAREDLATENYPLLADKLSRLSGAPVPQPPAVRAEVTLMQAVSDLVGGRTDEFNAALEKLEQADLTASLRLGLALLLLSKGDVARAEAVVSRTDLPADARSDARISASMVALWASASRGSVTGSVRQKLTSEFSSLCDMARDSADVYGAVSLLLAHLALRLGEVNATAGLLHSARREYRGTVEFMHLSALVDIYRVITYRRINPDRGLGQPEREAVARSLATLRECIALAEQRQVLRPLGPLYANLGVALHLKATHSTGEPRRQAFGESAEAFLRAATHAEESADLRARAANAWLLAGDPSSSAEIFAGLSAEKLPVDSQSNYAAALLMSGRPVAAIKILQDLSRQGAMSWQMLANLSIVLLVTGQPSASVTALELARPAAGRGRWRIDHLLSKAFLKLGQARSAETFLRQAIEQRSFDPRLYSEHLYCLQRGTVKDLGALLEELKKVLDLKKANRSVLEELEQQTAHALGVYQESVRKYGGRGARPGGLITHVFAEALEQADRLTKKLRALEDALSSRQTWSGDAVIEQIREITFEKFETPYEGAPAAPRGPVAPERTLELKRVLSSAERLLDGCDVPVALRPESLEVLSSLEAGGTDDGVGHGLAVAARVLENRLSEPLKCYRYVDGVEYKGFQRRVVHRVFNEMHGRAIMADEVGLGKTVEAGLIFTEYRVRQLVKRCLVLVPTVDLREQWLSELTTKFRLSHGAGEGSAAIQGGRFWRGWGEHTVCVATYQAAVANGPQLRGSNWDMVVADEAHHLRNRGSASFKLLARLPTRYLLLLTATPLQKSAEDIYSLASLVRPSLFGQLKRFRAEYGHALDEKPRNLTRLYTLLSQVMVRNTIVGVAGEMPTSRREFHNPNVRLSLPEMDFYKQVIKLVLAEAKQASKLPLLYYLLAREASSSPSTAIQTLHRVATATEGRRLRLPMRILDELAERIGARSKVAEVLRILEDVAPRKVLIFVEFRTTAVELGELLSADVVHGGLQPPERLQVVEAFRSDPRRRALIVTPAQGEGLNLEFCSVVVNYDLPWNPMRIEQRIGRVQRIGQTEKVVTIYSLASTNTIEQEIRDGLVRKVRLFQNVIGHTGLYLETDKRGEGLESRIHEIFRDAPDEESLRKSLSRFFEEDASPLVAAGEATSPVSAPVGVLGLPEVDD
jgi:superfamily II DNA or RNA helicase/tetratricopeptide (TPR) repeat protein